MSSVWYELKWYFLEKLNWCHPSDRHNKPKKETLFYTLYCWLFYPIPWMEPVPCWCCASVRGIIYGIIIGFSLGYFVS